MLANQFVLVYMMLISGKSLGETGLPSYAENVFNKIVFVYKHLKNLTVKQFLQYGLHFSMKYVIHGNFLN